MNYNRFYFLLKFAAKEDSLRVFRDNLIAAGKEEGEVNQIIESLNTLSDRNCSRAVGALMGMLRRDPSQVNIANVQEIVAAQKVTKSTEESAVAENTTNKFVSELNKLLENNSEKFKIIDLLKNINSNLYKLFLGQIANNTSISLNEIRSLLNDTVDLPNKYILWLTKRFGSNASKNEMHPLMDCLSIIKMYNEKESAIVTKYLSNAEFKENIDNNFPNKKWNTPDEIEEMSSDDMSNIFDTYRIINLSFRPDNIKQLTNLPIQDKIGEVGDWELWLPTSRVNSCAIARVDPETLTPKTTWCTARTTDSNLFYNHVSDSNGNLILFYIIKKNPVEDYDWLSVGFVRGNPVLRGQNGGVSVNRANYGLTEEGLREILGSNYESILKILKEKSDELGGKNPVMFNIEKGFENLENFQKMIRGNSKNEVSNFIYMYLRSNDVTSINKDIILYLIDKKMLEARHINDIINFYTDKLDFDFIEKLNSDLKDSNNTYLKSRLEEIDKMISDLKNNPQEQLILQGIISLYKKYFDGTIAVLAEGAVIGYKLMPIYYLKKEEFNVIASMLIYIAKNVNTPVNVLEILSKHTIPLVASSAKETLENIKSEKKAFYFTNKIVKIASRLSLKYN